MATRIDGKALAAQVKARTAEAAKDLPRRPGLAVILVGDDPASRVMAARSGVREWHTVTVPSAWVSSIAMGLPTMLLRPSTTHRFPAGEMPYSLSISMTPAGVQGRNTGAPMDSRPTFTGWKQSTSLSGAMAFRTASSSRCFGRGS